MTAREQNDPRIAKLESLVDELVKNAPEEHRIRHCMEAAGLKYCADPIARMKSVLAALDGIRGRHRAAQRET